MYFLSQRLLALSCTTRRNIQQFGGSRIKLWQLRTLKHAVCRVIWQKVLTARPLYSALRSSDVALQLHRTQTAACVQGEAFPAEHGESPAQESHKHTITIKQLPCSSEAPWLEGYPGQSGQTALWRCCFIPAPLGTGTLLMPWAPCWPGSW